MPEFRPIFDKSLERINRGGVEDTEIENMIREFSTNYLDNRERSGTRKRIDEKTPESTSRTTLCRRYYERIRESRGR